MKSLFLALSLSFSALAATNPVGQWVKYDVTSDAGEIEEQQLKEVISFNADSSEYLIRTITYYPDGTNSMVEELTDSYLSPDEVRTTVENCAEAGGELGSGNIGERAVATCKLDDISLAAIPFGLYAFSFYISDWDITAKFKVLDFGGM